MLTKQEKVSILGCLFAIIAFFANMFVPEIRKFTMDNIIWFAIILYFALMGYFIGGFWDRIAKSIEKSKRKVTSNKIWDLINGMEYKSDKSFPCVRIYIILPVKSEFDYEMVDKICLGFKCGNGECESNKIPDVYLEQRGNPDLSRYGLHAYRVGSP